MGLEGVEDIERETLVERGGFVEVGGRGTVGRGFEGRHKLLDRDVLWEREIG